MLNLTQDLKKSVTASQSPFWKREGDVERDAFHLPGR
jgi:hypothetical protein